MTQKEIDSIRISLVSIINFMGLEAHAKKALLRIILTSMNELEDTTKNEDHKE